MSLRRRRGRPGRCRKTSTWTSTPSSTLTLYGDLPVVSESRRRIATMVNVEVDDGLDVHGQVDLDDGRPRQGPGRRPPDAGAPRAKPNPWIDISCMDGSSSAIARPSDGEPRPRDRCRNLGVGATVAPCQNHAPAGSRSAR